MRLTYNNKIISRGDSTDYVNLQNKPSINDVELLGNLTTEDAKITCYCTQSEYDEWDSEGLINPTTFYVIDNGEVSDEGDLYDYNDLYNKPAINNGSETITLQGTKSLGDLNLYSKSETDTLLARSFASSEGTSTNVAKYMTLNGVEYKLADSGDVRLTDTVTGTVYKLIVTNGVLGIEEV